MPDTLADICARKREHLAQRQQAVTLGMLHARALAATPPRGFHQALKTCVAGGNIGLIAEIKKASPSKGLIREAFDPKALAMAYATNGAACLSVLTDTPYFQGQDDDLVAARAAVSLPVLRKDFMLDPYQILEARSLGADCILLIMAALSDMQARELEETAHALGMDVLIEVHDAPECDRALTHLRSRLLGINNRNLKTLEVSLTTSEVLRPLIPDEYTLVCESGIAAPADIARMRDLRIHCFLVGESLMRQDDVGAATRALLQDRQA
jgi:indole-3-glycerol phosphate synthase